MPILQEVQHALLTDAKVPAQVLVHAQVVAHRFILHRGDVDAGQLTCAKGQGEAAGVAAVSLDAIGGLAGNQPGAATSTATPIALSCRYSPKPKQPAS